MEAAAWYKCRCWLISECNVDTRAGLARLLQIELAVSFNDGEKMYNFTGESDTVTS